jgi:hypothetical protein
MKIQDTFVVMSLYNDDISWLKDYTDNYVILNAGEPREGTIQVPHTGYNVHAYTQWIVDNYDNLPETVMFIKGTIFTKCISREEFDKVCNNKVFTPLLKKDHKVDGAINKYSEDGMYNETNNSWYINHYPHEKVHSYRQFSELMGLSNPEYLTFAPGACYIVPRENILKHTREFYQKLASLMDYHATPSESHMVERALYEIWK